MALKQSAFDVDARKCEALRFIQSSLAGWSGPERQQHNVQHFLDSSNSAWRWTRKKWDGFGQTDASRSLRATALGIP